MASKCEAWRASTDGSLHQNERLASRHDLQTFVARLPGQHPNFDMWEALAKNADEAIRLLQAYAKSHPGTGGVSTPQKSQKGPAKGPKAKGDKPAPDTIMGCCGKTFSVCDCDDAHLDRGRGQQP